MPSQARNSIEWKETTKAISALGGIRNSQLSPHWVIGGASSRFGGRRFLVSRFKAIKICVESNFVQKGRDRARMPPAPAGLEPA